jgi:hypothetical protein
LILKEKSGQRPPEVARLSSFFLYPCNANGETDFAQFPIVQKTVVPYETYTWCMFRKGQLFI